MTRAAVGLAAALLAQGCIPPGNGVYERAHRPPIQATAPRTNPLFSLGLYGDSASDLPRLEVLPDGDIWLPRFACGDLRLRYVRQASEREVRRAELRHVEPAAYVFQVVEHRAPTTPEAPCANWLASADHFLIQPLQINTTPQAAPLGNAMEARRVSGGAYEYEALFSLGATDPVIRRLDQ